MATISTSIRIDEDLWNRIGDLGEMIDQTRSEIVARILLNGIVEEERFHRAMQDPIYGELGRLLLKPEVIVMIAKLAGETLTPAEKAKFGRYSETLESKRAARKSRKLAGA